jgi:hypothetical protein
MNNIYRIIILLLVIGFTACTQAPQKLSAAYDEDKDIGLGGTGLLATAGDEDSDGGLGGTGILGEITGYGSIFVNGIEIEYDDDTPFTINGRASAPQQLEIGDVVEVLTLDSSNHTQARVINLRHEVVGQVDSVGPDTFSFTINGQSIVQAIDASIPKLGDTVAVSGFRIDEQTIIATRIAPVGTKQTLVRTDTSLPFKDKATRWLVQTFVYNNKAVVQLDGVTHVITVKGKIEESSNDGQGIRVLQLQKTSSDQLKLERVIDLKKMPRGQRASAPSQWRSGNIVHKTVPRSRPESGFGTGQDSQPGSGQNNGEKQSGSSWQ